MASTALSALSAPFARYLLLHTTTPRRVADESNPSFSPQGQQTAFSPSTLQSGSGSILSTSSSLSAKLPLAITTAALALLTANALISIAQTLRLRRHHGSKHSTAPLACNAHAVAAGKASYADADGVATPDAVARYGCKVKSRVAILVGVAATGFAIAAARAVVGVLGVGGWERGKETGLFCVVQWVGVGLWVS
ncbi:hypothetical protein HDK64DRAFT_86328 [Phyllosticta capitalensis]